MIKIISGWTGSASISGRGALRCRKPPTSARSAGSARITSTWTGSAFSPRGCRSSCSSSSSGSPSCGSSAMLRQAMRSRRLRASHFVPMPRTGTCRRVSPERGFSVNHLAALSRISKSASSRSTICCIHGRNRSSTTPPGRAETVDAGPRRRLPVHRFARRRASARYTARIAPSKRRSNLASSPSPSSRNGRRNFGHLRPCDQDRIFGRVRVHVLLPKVYQQQRCVTVQRFVTAQQPRRVFGRVLPLQRHLVIPVDDEKQRMARGRSPHLPAHRWSRLVLDKFCEMAGGLGCRSDAVTWTTASGGVLSPAASAVYRGRRLLRGVARAHASVPNPVQYSYSWIGLGTDEEVTAIAEPELPATFTFAEAEDRGLSRRRLQGLQATGAVERIGRGLYRRTDEEPVDHYLIEIAAKAHRPTLCLLCPPSRAPSSAGHPVPVTPQAVPVPAATRGAAAAAHQARAHPPGPTAHRTGRPDTAHGTGRCNRSRPEPRAATRTGPPPAHARSPAAWIPRPDQGSPPARTARDGESGRTARAGRPWRTRRPATPAGTGRRRPEEARCPARSPTPPAAARC